MYQKFQKIIDDINTIISQYETEDTVDSFKIDALSSNVAFGSSKFRFAFLIEFFARFYSKKFGTHLDDMRKKLWGDNYFD